MTAFSRDLPKYTPGDKLRVTYDYTADVFGKVNVPSRDNLLSNLTIEVIERADDPSKDLLGTVRRGPLTSPVVKGYDKSDDPRPWMSVRFAIRYSDEEVTRWEKLAPVEGTPAAEVQKPWNPFE